MTPAAIFVAARNALAMGRISLRLGQRADPEAPPDEKAAEDVEHGLYSVRDECEGVSDDPGRNLRRRKKRTRDDADRRHTRPLPDRMVELFRRAGTWT